MYRRVFILFILTTLLYSYPCSAQEPEKQKQFYLEEWKRKRTTGWVLLGVGLPVFLAGSSMVFSGDGGPLGAILMVGGAAATVASIPVFLSARKNKRKAAELSLMPRSIQLPKPISRRPGYSAIQLTITL